MVSAGVRPESNTVLGLLRPSRFKYAMRTSKNSSKLDDTIHTKRNRSNNGTFTSSACANTRRLNANKLDSRQKICDEVGILLPCMMNE